VATLVYRFNVVATKMADFVSFHCGITQVPFLDSLSKYHLHIVTEKSIGVCSFKFHQLPNLRNEKSIEPTKPMVGGIFCGVTQINKNQRHFKICFTKILVFLSLYIQSLPFSKKKSIQLTDCHLKNLRLL
jgi:hypothetical protein